MQGYDQEQHRSCCCGIVAWSCGAAASVSARRSTLCPRAASRPPPADKAGEKERCPSIQRHARAITKASTSSAADEKASPSGSQGSRLNLWERAEEMRENFRSDA
ncbi:hypothetical protein SRHO_G00083900 [Serrasalmus rhombeus]